MAIRSEGDHDTQVYLAFNGGIIRHCFVVVETVPRGTDETVVRKIDFISKGQGQGKVAVALRSHVRRCEHSPMHCSVRQ